MDTKLLKQKILDLAIRGKLVPQNPDDEPASELLKRIHTEKEKLIAEGKIKRPKNAADKLPYRKLETSEAPFEIPESWELCCVEELFNLNPKNNVDDNKTAGFIPMELVSSGFVNAHTFEKRKWGEVKKGHCHFQNGDIGIAKISPCFENRKSTIFHGLPNNIGAGTTELVILRSEEICVEFYLYLFKSAWYINEGTKYFKGVVGQQRVNKEIFTTLLIPLPPLAEQQRIVVEIEKWFAVIDEMEASRQDLQEAIKLAKGKILDLAIHGKLVPQDPNDEPATELLKRINPAAKSISPIRNSADSPPYRKEPATQVQIPTCSSPAEVQPNENIADLPKGWCATTFENICLSIASKKYQIKQSEIKNVGKYPVISQSSNYIEGYFDEEDELFHVVSPIIIFGDHTRIVKYIDFDFIVGADGVKILQPLIHEKFCYYLAQYAAANIPNRGYGRHYGELSKYIVPLPPINEQSRIVNTLQHIEKIINAIIADL